MTDDRNMEIYRQRYETFRHLDKMRWQMLQILVAIGTATTLILRSTSDSGSLAWWFFMFLGAGLVVLAIAMHKINQGLRKNGEALKAKGEVIGDTKIPDVSNQWASIAHWLMLGTLLLGVVLLVYGTYAAHSLHFRSLS
ncbi:MAG: hypothetical protein OXD33_10010 [Rhodobacteraceae bacterium]|nr:hypothetical protein [Paracoccaceae bacterium]